MSGFHGELIMKHSGRAEWLEAELERQKRDEKCPEIQITATEEQLDMQRARIAALSGEVAVEALHEEAA
jgi:hypothetical protein